MGFSFALILLRNYGHDVCEVWARSQAYLGVVLSLVDLFHQGRIVNALITIVVGARSLLNRSELNVVDFIHQTKNNVNIIVNSFRYKKN
jgi:hypothetical protein